MCKKAFKMSNAGSVIKKGLESTFFSTRGRVEVKIWKLEWSQHISSFHAIPGHLNVVFVDPRCQFEINQIVSTKRCLKADSQRISSLRDSNKLFSPLNPRPLENRVQTFSSTDAFLTIQHHFSPCLHLSTLLFCDLCACLFAFSARLLAVLIHFLWMEATPRSECQISHRDNAVTSLVPVNLARTTSAIT